MLMLAIAFMMVKLPSPPMNTTLRTAVRALAALDLAAARATQRGNDALAIELEHARCAGWFAARALGCDANELEYLTTRLVRVAQALERQALRLAPAANDVAQLAA